MFANLISTPLLLASASPRRREILERLGFTCEIKPAGIDETAIRHEDAATQTVLLAQKKAEVVARAGRLTVAADTVVVLDGAVLEKPQHRDEARTMLQRLSGREHLVHTAVALIFPAGERLHFIETTRVFFDQLSAHAIETYIATPHPYDKAGGYGAQDAFGMAYIRRFEGCYFNVMGFPANRFMRTLSENHTLLRG